MEGNTKPISDMVDESGMVTNEDIRAAAKKVATGVAPKYFVKASKRQRRLFNPITDKLSQKSVIKTEAEFSFIEVTKECFDYYCEYLKSRASYMLTQAQIHFKR